MASDFQSIPIIDISPFLDKFNDPNMAKDKEVQKVVKNLDKACKEAGFFYLTTTTEKLPENVVPITMSTWRQFEQFPIFSIRNGTLADVKPLLIRPAIPVAYHWVFIDKLPPKDAIKHIDAYIRMYDVRLKTHLTGNAALSDTDRPKVALVLGTLRAAMTSYYELTDADIIPEELADSLLTAESADGGKIVLYQTEEQMGRGDITGTFTIEEKEKRIICELVKIGYGVLPMQGYSLLTDGHHYLNDPTKQSYKSAKTAEAGILKATEWTGFVGAAVETMKDVMWHKSGHPVVMTLKHRLATDEKLPLRLRDVGSGACASRLPAIEPEVRALTTYYNLCSTVGEVWNGVQGGIDCRPFEVAIKTIKMYPVGHAPGRQDTDEEVPQTVVDRETAIRWAREIVDKNLPTVATCFGFYNAMIEQGGVAGIDITLAASKALTKLKDTHLANYLIGSLIWGDFTASRNSMRQAGDIPVTKYNLRF